MKPKTRKKKVNILAAEPEKKKSHKRIFLIGAVVLGSAVILSLVFGYFKSPQIQEAKQAGQTAPFGQTGQSSGEKRVVLSPQPVRSDGPVTAALEGGDASGKNLVYKWERNGAEIPNQSSATLEKSQFKRGDTIQAAVWIGGVQEPLKSEPAVVQNSPPKVASAKIEPGQPVRGDNLQVKVESSDEDGDPITYRYRWFKEDGTPAGSEAEIPARPFLKGTRVNVEVIPTDGKDEGKAVIASVVIADSPPRITSIPGAFSGREYSYQVAAEDPDSDPLTFKLAKGPDGMTIDAKTGLIKWAFTGKEQGVFPVEVRVSDPDGLEVVQSFEIPLSFSAAPAPSAASAGSASATP